MICRGPSVLADGIDVGDDEVTALVEDEKSSKVSRSVAGDGDGCCFRSSPGSGRLCDLESALPRANEAAAHPASLDDGGDPVAALRTAVFFFPAAALGVAFLRAGW